MSLNAQQKKVRENDRIKSQKNKSGLKLTEHEKKKI